MRCGVVAALDAMDEGIAREGAGEREENARSMGRGKRTAFRVAHAKEWGSIILDEFRQLVASGLALSPNARPAVGGTKWPPGD